MQRGQKKLLILQTEVSIHKQAFGDTKNLKSYLSKLKMKMHPLKKKKKKRKKEEMQRVIK